ncbi:TPA: hypothetical protein ACKP0S_000498 [Pseudomonas aeruginosa]
MENQKNQSIYMPNDKAICDAVQSSKVNNQSLAEIFFKRGIIVSPKTERKPLALYYSRMFTGYKDFDDLTSNLQSTTHREKTTSRFIKDIAGHEALDAANELKEIINSKDYPKDANASISKHLNETVLTITYSDINPNKSQLQQVITKEAVISISSNSNELIIRSPYNEDAEKWTNHLIEILSIKKERPVKAETISLEFIDNAELRSKFLEDLINNIDGFSLRDVSKVSIFNPEKNSRVESEIDQAESEEDDIGSDTHVFKASLNGKGVLNSKEIDLLHSKGFYTYHAVWTCTEASATPDIYEIEVKFEDSDNCTSFSHKVKGFYRYISSDKHSTNRFPPTSTIEREIQSKIETKARELIEKLTK